MLSPFLQELESCVPMNGSGESQLFYSSSTSPMPVRCTVVTAMSLMLLFQKVLLKQRVGFRVIHWGGRQGLVVGSAWICKLGFRTIHAGGVWVGKGGSWALAAFGSAKVGVIERTGRASGQAYRVAKRGPFFLTHSQI